MVTFRLPAPAEAERLAILERLGLLDTPPEREFDTIVKMASHLLGCKIALVSLVDKDRQWFKAKVGLEAAQTPREVAFCAHAVAANDALVVPDATADERFAGNPLVTGAPGVRFTRACPCAPGRRTARRCRWARSASSTTSRAISAPRTSNCWASWASWSRR
jgi:GAF domain-containing protein